MEEKELIHEFCSPGAAYRGKPFWAWNGELESGELLRQSGIMKEMGLGGYFMHSRSGLITEYLSDEWFDLINEVADAAERDGMEAWLYDEDRWPSGSAGGKVTVDPQYRMKALYLYEMPVEKYCASADTYALFAAKIDGVNLWGYRQIEKDAANPVAELEQVQREMPSEVAEAPGEWKILRFAVVKSACSSEYNGTTYIDTMSRKATERFIELTHEEYLRHCGDRLGRSIRGIFSDEPHRGRCMDNRRENDGVISCAICWTDDILEEFERRYGYDAAPILPELFYRNRGEKVSKLKLHYIDLANNLFVERFAEPIHDWCKAHNLLFTGHVLHEDSLTSQTVPNGSVMRFYEHMDYPGVDCLTEGNRCYWIVKQLSSVGRQLGKKWLLSELYGGTGWQFDLRAHKAVGDWQSLFGINVRCQHLSWYTMEGAAKRDYPASILHQSPWYPEYAAVEDYFARFGLVISEGAPACDVLMLNPIESIWCQVYLGWARGLANASADTAPYEERYAQMFHMLTGNQIDFDYGEEQMMKRLCSVEKDADGRAVLRLGKQAYHVVIVGNMLTIRQTTLSLLEDFMKLGGSVIFAGETPAYVDAVRSEAAKKLAESGTCVPLEETALVAAVRTASEEYVSVTDADGNADKEVFVQVRKNFGAGACAVVVLNTNREQPKTGLTLTWKAPSGAHLQEWHFADGTRNGADHLLRRENACVSIPLTLEAAGTRCFVLTKEHTQQLPEAAVYETISQTVVKQMFDYSLNEQNVCVLDWVRWHWSGEAFSEVGEVLKCDRAIRDALGIERRGGSMLQPWYAKKTDARQYGVLELEYEFYVEELPTGAVLLAGERPEENHYRLNGMALSPDGGFWVDSCFKTMIIPEGTLKKGRNIVTAQVEFKATTNIEALYLIGDFGVQIQGRSCTLTKLPQKIGCGNYEEYGLPFYTGSVTYHVTPEMYRENETLAQADRVVLTPLHFTGGCAKVTAHGKTAVLAWEPYEADVTQAVRAAEEIDVTVVGTRRNVFGPLHQIPKIAPACGPGEFVTQGEKWTDDYSLIDSGLRGIAIQAQKTPTRKE